ncbi:transporter substrate-binding domain-containing protein [Psychromonas aquatilis]|uniref:Transporter substrate-binding domain-containing protein n=1 Tax=Psychromonas aquatilis TaxID=2005072 RepID=A0ABU9GL99_9GAMM
MHLFIRQLIVICLLCISSFNVLALQEMKVKFATDINYYPFEYITEDNKLQGFDIDIAKAICEQVNLQCTFEHRRFDDLLIMLPFKRYDAVIAALDITDQRSKVVDFSDSYYKIAPAFISREKFDGQLSLKGKFIGVQANTSHQNYLVKAQQSQDSYIVPYFSSKAALEDLQRQKIDAVFADFAVIKTFLDKQKEPSQLVISRREDVFMGQFSAGYGIAVDKGNDILRERLNQGLKLITENGTYEEVFKKYFH